MTIFRKPTGTIVEIRFIDRWKHLTGWRIPEPASTARGECEFGSIGR